MPFHDLLHALEIASQQRTEALGIDGLAQPG